MEQQLNMTDNFNAEIAKSIIDSENINITESNSLKDFAAIVMNLFIFIISIYLFIYIASGVALKCLSLDKQIILENFISPSIQTNLTKITIEEQERLNKIKQDILNADIKFPKTSNLEIRIINHKQLNALCYPNGNIYITSALYNELETDEELTFVIAHEMAHYRNKDHLLNLRRNISNGAVLLLLSLASPNESNLSRYAESGLNLTDLKFSRGSEAKADRYAVSIMNALYGNARAGVNVLETLKEKNKFDIEFLSTHPNMDKRIKYVKKFSY